MIFSKHDSREGVVEKKQATAHDLLHRSPVLPKPTESLGRVAEPPP